ncbi:MAG: nitrate/nitrite transporter NrtS [Proteobacteria bacterium]|nr:nitrate/nitrite transporter NrtS [Pseudomonadota bacterium]
MLDSATIRKALTVAAVVGTVLLLINQYDALFGEAEFRVIPAALTYCVPFVVFLAGRLSGKNKEL